MLWISLLSLPTKYDGLVDNMYNVAEKRKMAVKKVPLDIMSWRYKIACGFVEIFPKELCLHGVHLVASATLEVRRLPASIEVVVICAVTTIADGGAVSVLAVNVVVAALSCREDLAVLAASRRHGIGFGSCIVNHGWQLSAARIDKPV